MTHFINQLPDLILPGAYKLQFAINQQWEKALKIDLTKHTQFTDEQIENFLGINSKIIAGELFFKSRDGEDCYFGIQWDHSFLNAKTHLEFFKKYLEIATLHKNSSFVDLLKSLGKTLCDNENTFTDAECTSIDLGVVDFWASLGPVSLWKRGEDTNRLLENETLATIKPFTHIQENSKNYVGLEFVHNASPKHWFSFQVSDQSDHNTWVLDFEKIKHLIHINNLTINNRHALCKF